MIMIVRFKMSVKRKLTTKTLKEKCDILTQIEKGTSNKDASETFCVLKNTISTWMKNKEKLFRQFYNLGH